MASNKICIIACINNEFLWNECLMYINRLHVPDGFFLDVMSIVEAHSMTSGYNEAMTASDAKYKIYIHQDTFLTDIYLLDEILDIFNDNSIGMIGLTGTVNFPVDGCMFNTSRVTSAYWRDNTNFSNCFEHQSYNSIEDVSLIDGLFIATQYDIPWREDCFEKWDHYDSSQSIEFLKHGYRLVVPIYNKPLCIHNDGQRLSLKNYKVETQIFLNEYKDFILERWNIDTGLIDLDRVSNNNIISIKDATFYETCNMKKAEYILLLNSYLRTGLYENAIKISLDKTILELSEYDADILLIITAMHIAKREFEMKIDNTIISNRTADDIIKIMNEIIVYIRRVESDVDDTSCMELVWYIMNNKVSIDAVWYIIQLTSYIYKKEYIMKRLREIINKAL